MTADHTCAGCACQAEHDGDYGASGRPGPCPPHTCSVTADHTLERLSAEERHCECYDQPGQDCWTAGPAVIAAEGMCGPCATPLAAHLADVEARLAAVEALHREGEARLCKHDLLLWPCPTYRALHPDPSARP